MIRRRWLGFALAISVGNGVHGRTPETPSLDLVLRVTEETVRILDQERTSREPTDLRRPVLTPEIASRVPRGTRELVTSFHDRRGRALTAWGWPAIPPEFHPDGRMPERPEHETQAPASLAPGLPSIDDRLMTLPVPAGAVYLAFVRNEVAIGAAGTPFIRATTLGVYWLVPDVSLPPLFPPRLEPPSPFNSGQPLPRAPLRALPSRRTQLVSDCGFGRVQSLSSPWLKGNPADLFDIVIVGDGYQKPDLAKFDTATELLLTGLLGLKRDASGNLVPDANAGVAPYSTLRDRINVHVVNAISDDSGVDYCPAGGGVKNTYFGSFGLPLNPGYLDSPCLVLVATEAKRAMKAAGYTNPGLPELIVLLANCEPAHGGRAKFLARWTLTPAFPASNLSGTPELVAVGAHESAHAVVGVADEIIRCVEWNKLPVHPCNVALEADLAAMPNALQKPIWWWSLTFPEEQSGGTFKAIHRVGDTLSGPQNTVPEIQPPGNNRMLGAYWGALYGDCPSSPPKCPSCDPRFDQPEGRAYYRPTATCRMRFLDDPSFCRVCMHELTHAVEHGTWGKSPECFP